jgi:TolB-like protein/Tfp pilus assembly protein PilF
MEPTRSENPPGSVPPAARPEISESAVRRELEKVLSSERFREAEGLRRFLRCAVEHSLRGEGDQLKEYRIGVEVLDRDSSFDPRLDPVVRMAARRLRVKLKEYYEAEGRQDPIRIDVPKGGYAAVFSANAFPELLVPENSPHDSSGAMVAPRRRTPVELMLAAGAIAVILILIFSSWAIFRRRAQPSGSAHPIHSVAVLPLQNLSGDASNEYLADGLTEELLTDLAQIRSLRVISRTSIMTYKGTKKRLPEIARELNVDAVVEGSVMRSGNRVQVTAQLIEAPSDTHLWAQSYQGDLSDLLTLQNRVAQAIVQQVGVKLTPEEQGLLKTVHLASPDAHEAYLLGRFYWNKRTTEGFNKAVEYFQRATEKDPEYSQAYAGLADCYVLLAEYTLRPSKEVLPKARDAAVKALQLDETLAEAHASLAAVKADYDWDWKGAELELRRAIELNPGYATAHQWYAELLAEEGRRDEAIFEIKRALDLDPLSLIVNAMYGRVLEFAGLTDQAMTQLRKTLELDPDFSIAHYDLGRAYVRKGDLAHATPEFQIAAKFRVSEREGALAYAYAKSGKTAEARELMNKYLKESKSSYVTWYGITFFYVGLGQKNEAFACLDKAYQQHDSRLRDVKQEPLLDSLHSDPRFVRLVQSLGL